jgi:fructose/tagatose bisphosphate aldolase
MTNQELKVVKEGLETVISEAKALRVPPIIQAQTGQFALVQALKTDAKVDALTKKVNQIAKAVDEIAVALVDIEVSKSVMPATVAQDGQAGQ